MLWFVEVGMIWYMIEVGMMVNAFSVCCVIMLVLYGFLVDRLSM